MKVAVVTASYGWRWLLFVTLYVKTETYINMFEYIYACNVKDEAFRHKATLLLIYFSYVLILSLQVNLTDFYTERVNLIDFYVEQV